MPVTHACSDQGATAEMLPFLFFTSLACSAASRLDSIDPYDDSPDTKYYLNLGCNYLAQQQGLKYETRSVQEKLANVFYENCINAVWPGCEVSFLSSEEDSQLKYYCPFKKDDTLAYHDRPQPLKASEDGFLVPQTTDNPFFIFYHENRPPMKLAILKKLSWPQDESLMTVRNRETLKFSTAMRGVRSSHTNFIIKLESKSRGSIPMACLGYWIQAHGFDKYDSLRLRLFKDALEQRYPGIGLSKIHRLGPRTRIVPLHDLFTLIPPGIPIALRYDPETFTLVEMVTISKFSTIITEFEHEGSTYCLALSFDISLPGEKSGASFKPLRITKPTK